MEVNIHRSEWMRMSQIQNHQPSNNISKKSYEKTSKFKHFEILITKRNRFTIKLWEYILSVPLIIHFKTVMIPCKIVLLELVHHLNYETRIIERWAILLSLGKHYPAHEYKPEHRGNSRVWENEFMVLLVAVVGVTSKKESDHLVYA